MTAYGIISSDLDPGSAIAPQLYLRLRDAIIRNRFAPGDRISESEIARACDVSRQPVREAFIKLAGEGLLAILPQRGTVISRIAYSAVMDSDNYSKCNLLVSLSGSASIAAWAVSNIVVSVIPQYLG